MTGIVLSTGLLSVPASMSYGLTKGAFLSTEAASSPALMVSKVATFAQLGVLPFPTLMQSLFVSSYVMTGSFVGKLVVQRMSPQTFQFLLDGLLFCSGLSLIWAAFG